MQHSDVLPDYEYAIVETLKDPDSVRKSDRFQNARLFTRFFQEIRGGKYTVVVVVSDSKPEERDWVITAYITRKISGGIVEWERK